MAHALLDYDGPCRNIHGHSYRLEITIIGEPLLEAKNPKLGMVMDFGDLKAIVKKAVLDDFDHTLVLYDKSFSKPINELENIFGKIRLLPYQPTCENLVLDIRNRIVHLLPKDVELVVTRLYETASSYAEIVEFDNL